MIRSLLASSQGARRSLLSSSRRRSLRTSSARTLSAFSQGEGNKNDEWFFAWMAAAGVATFAATENTRLEESKHDDDDNDDTVSEDPYDNLPEEDEPTHCSICLTYRQGPCRPYWRKVEACTKDNELKKDETTADEGKSTKNDQEENDNTKPEGEQVEVEQPDSPCLKYMLPWIECATGFRNLYSLIELDTNYTAGIADLEKEAAETLCWAPGKEPKIDWMAWKTFVLAHDEWKPAKKRTKKQCAAATVSLWKTLDQTQDPEVIEIEATVPSKEGAGILECAYALDQDGNVLGFSYGTKPSEATKQEGSEDTKENVELKIRLLPQLTRRIVIKASYTQPKKDDAKDNDPLDAHIYQSRYYSLKKMAKAENKE